MHFASGLNLEPVMTHQSRANGAFLGITLGVLAGVAFMGYATRPPAAVAAAPVAIDYGRITAAVRAGFPEPAPVAKPVPVATPVAVAKPAPVAKRKPVVRPVVYVVRSACGCSL